MRHVLALLPLLAPPALAQMQKAEGTLHARVVEDRVEVAIEIDIDRGWHLYHEDLGDGGGVGLPTKVRFLVDGEQPDDVTWSPVTWPEPEVGVQPGLGKGGTDATILQHEGRIVLYASGSPASAIDLDALTVTLDGLTCQDDGMCIPYKEELDVEGEGSAKLWEGMPSETAVEIPEPTGPVRAKLYVRHLEAETRVVLVLDVEEGWHVYAEELGDGHGIGQATVVALAGDGLTFGGLHWPKPDVLTQKNLGPKDKTTGERTDAWILGHHGRVVVRTSALVAEDTLPGEVHATVEGQACLDDGMCVPLELELEASGEGPDELFAEPYPPYVARDAEAREAGSEEQQELPLWGFLLTAIGAGLLTLLMPCTYPMIPITISFFTKQADERQGGVLPLSLAYGTGIVVIFVAIGVALGPPIITFASHWATNLVIGGLFVFFALSLFGIIDLQPPRFLMNAAGQASMQGGLLGVFLMGATLVITSFTCTAPFIGSLLSIGATSGETDLGRVALGMGVFGLTMAIPFVLLSLVPGKIKQMPKSGEWMKTLKVTLGFVELAAALKFLSNVDLALDLQVFPKEVFLGLWIAIFLAAALYLLGAFAKNTRPGAWRRLTGIAFSGLSAYWLLGLAGIVSLDWITIAMAPPYGFQVQAESRSIVKDDYPAARALAKENDKLLLVNFTGFLCVNCRTMEESVFKTPRVSEALQDFVEVRMHYDHYVDAKKEESRELQLRLLASIGAPMYVVLDPETETILSEVAFTSEEGFLAFLEQARKG